MREIHLTQDKSALVDDKYFDYLSKFHWSLLTPGGKRSHELFYACTTFATGKKFKRTCVLMHRVVWALMNNDPLFISRTTEYIDHVDFNGLNNTASNLRACSNTENQIHKRLQRNNTTGYRGICKSTHDTWIVRFTAPEIGRVYGGTYKSIDEAIAVYNEMAVKHFGKFALLNEVPNSQE